MSEYELYHAAARKHKYIKKIGNRYFYSQDEIAAYLKGKKNDVTLEKGNDYDSDGSKMKDYHVDFNKKRGTYKYTDGSGKEHKEDYATSDKIGVRVGNKKIQVYNTKNQKFYKDGERWSVKRRGRFKSEYAEDGSTHTLDLSDKKTFKKRDAADKKREKQLEDWQVKQGFRKTDAQLNKEKKERASRKRKKAVASVKKTTTKSISSLKNQSAKGKKALNSLYKNRPKIRHETVIK